MWWVLGVGAGVETEFFWRGGLMAGLQVGWALGCSGCLGLRSAVPVPHVPGHPASICINHHFNLDWISLNVVPIKSATFRLEYKDDYKYEFSALSTYFRFLGWKFSSCTCSELVHKVLIVPQPKHHYWHGQAFEKKEKESRARSQTNITHFHSTTARLQSN